MRKLVISDAEMVQRRRGSYNNGYDISYRQALSKMNGSALVLCLLMVWNKGAEKLLCSIIFFILLPSTEISCSRFPCLIAMSERTSK